MFIIKTCSTYKLLRERESKEQREGDRPEIGNEQRAEARERAEAGERERERRPVSGRESGGWQAEESE
jgi:hypothetical protein